MKAHVVQIGNSKGIRIPKSVIEQCQLYERSISLFKRDNCLFGRLPKHRPAESKPSSRCIATAMTSSSIVMRHQRLSGGKTERGGL